MCEHNVYLILSVTPEWQCLQNDMLMERVIACVLLADTQTASHLLIDAENRGYFQSAFFILANNLALFTHMGGGEGERRILASQCPHFL